ncbi:MULTISPECIES: hypothetical protein [unclassified Acinetobacter]|uniref:hypothetical protein n=1 Tax=unclassified Acinetobacter TaxID=196816 RepID=UPI00190C4075|nr:MULTISPECIES: hypothetical protein [unclassified Acinetobacter]MBK0062183.1 hypothetical protein [Acinetobacter sp. S55]MBK0065987.1 hypothetical protein [Acinetobacter sp. S54]
MEQNTLNHNRSSFQLRMKHVAIGASMLFGLTGAYALVSEKPTPITTYPLSKPTEYGVSAIKVDNNKSSGEAVMKLDGFYIYTSFDFEMHKENYGVIGSEHEVIEITNLAIDRITSIGGQEYSDFTDRNDHRNINTLIATYIEKNHLAEDKT